MTYREREENLRPPEVILKEAGFTISQRCYSRASCFDFAARKNEDIVFIKIQPDIDNFSQSDSTELRVISRCVSAALLLIAEKTRKKPLEDDTVYSRYNILAVTPKTFENIVLRNLDPLIQAGPGGYYVEIDCETIRRRRLELGLSVGEMAKMIGISRRSLYGYERGMGKASVAAAHNLIWALGVPVVKPVNVFKKSKDQRRCFLSKAKYAIARHKLLQKILRRLSHCHVTTVRKAPFDFVINVTEEKMKIIGGVASKEEKELDRRVDEIVSVSNVVRAQSILVTDKGNISKDIQCISQKEFSKIKDPEDLIAKL